jgi:monoterpene epsilon-lactone hydrolase
LADVLPEARLAFQHMARFLAAVGAGPAASADDIAAA